MYKSTLLKMFLLFVIVASNVYASQQYSNDLFAVLIDRDQDVALRILKSKHGDLGSTENKLFLNNYTDMDYDSFFELDKLRESQRIKDLETALVINPLHPAILNQLSQKYKKAGNHNKSQITLRRAHEIDPINY